MLKRAIPADTEFSRNSLPAVGVEVAALYLCGLALLDSALASSRRGDNPRHRPWHRAASRPRGIVCSTVDCSAHCAYNGALSLASAR